MTGENITENISSYKGSFILEITDKAGTRNIPSNDESITINGRLISIRDGKFWLIDKIGYKFNVNERSFGWGLNFIKYIKDHNGNLLWVNKKFKNLI
ncbi:hypothetical protein C0583_00590 [Candidatus Parcubacteria bacterium]|nr:MAG: hypothetical protein C0583_00590 [Candidatus Parcubacteria bacterium]